MANRPQSDAPPAFDLDDFARVRPVSHETKVALARYDALLLKWAGKINLVGKATLADRWRRHFLDSAQVFDLLPAGARRLIDLGAGAGFPGLVLAILGAARGLRVELIESDQKKCAFLRAVTRETAAPAVVHAARAEALRLPPADIVTARALAPLNELLELAAPFVGETTRGFFLKGRDVDVELTRAAKYWKLDVIRHPSRTAPEATILEVRSFRRVAAPRSR